MKQKIAILDSNYRDQQYSGLAASWLRWELQKRGISEVAANIADYIFITVASQQGVKSVKRELRKNKNAKIIMGGCGCYAPAIFDDMADIICVGEGKNFIDVFLENGYEAVKSLPETWIPGDTKIVIPNLDFPFDIPPIQHPDGTIRVFLSRGCKYKCLFCQTGWESPYRINPDMAKLQKQINSIESRGKKIAVITNDGAEQNVVSIKSQQEFISVRMDNLKKIMPVYRDRFKSVRIGVEGISERLRKMVLKPISNNDLIEISFNLLQNGVGVRWFFIVGLPGETYFDYDDLKSVINELKKFPKGVVMMNFHAFIPQPATPLAVLPLHDGYWDIFDEFRRWFFHGPGFTRRVQIIAPAQHKGRITRAKQSMAATEEQIREGWFLKDNANWRIKYNIDPSGLRKIATKYLNNLNGGA